MAKKTFITKKISEQAENYLSMVAEKQEPPILKEFCLLNKYNYKSLIRTADENQEIREILDIIIDNREVYLEKGMLAGRIGAIAAIFALKQLGWNDGKQTISINTNSNTDSILEKLSMLDPNDFKE